MLAESKFLRVLPYLDTCFILSQLNWKEINVFNELTIPIAARLYRVVTTILEKSCQLKVFFLLHSQAHESGFLGFQGG